MIASVPFGRQEYLQNVTSERQSLLQEAPLSTEDVDGWLGDLKEARKFPANRGMLPNCTTKRSRWLVDDWLVDVERGLHCTTLSNRCCRDFDISRFEKSLLTLLINRSAFSFSQVYLM